MADIGKPNPYQLFTNPLPTPPSRGGLGDFLREITTFRGSAPSQVTVPTTSQNPYGVLPGPEIYRNLPVAPAVTPTVARQVNGQTVVPKIKIPTLAESVQRTGLPAYDKQSALVQAPKGYTAPTPQDIATSDAVSKAYWAPYARQQAIQNEGLAIRRLEAQAKATPKPPTLRDQLYGQAVEASKALYELDTAAASTAPENEREKSRQAARRKYLQGIIDLAQPKAAEAGILRGE